MVKTIDIMHKIKVLYVDDEQHNLAAFKSNFRRDFIVYTAESADQGLEILKNEPISVLLSDQRMPKMTGVDFFEKVKEKYPNIVRILVTGYTDMEALVKAVNKAQIYKYINKPWDNEKLKEIILKANELFELRSAEINKKEELETVNSQLEFMLRQKLLS